MTNHFNCHEKERIKGEFCGGELEIMIERSQWGVGFGLPDIPDG